MNIEIKKLTPELMEDYFDFFDNRAFTDDSPYRCYCQIYQMSKDEYQQHISAAQADPGKVSRQVAEKQIARGDLCGYLVYTNGVAIGWCNANDRANFPTDSCGGEHFHITEAGREMAVVCFEIAPEFRGQGIATALLNKVISDAKFNNYSAVVSFPVVRDEWYEWDCTGPIRLYEKFGFDLAEKHDNFVVMRKTLN